MKFKIDLTETKRGSHKGKQIEIKNEMVVIIRFNNELNEIQSDFTSGPLHKLFSLQ